MQKRSQRIAVTILTSVLAFFFTLQAVPRDVLALDSEYRAVFLTDGRVTNNENRNVYSVYASTVTSYLTEVSEGVLMRVEGISDGMMLVEYMDYSGKITDSFTFKRELAYFGGFYAGSDAYYCVYGQSNSEQSDEMEILRVVKYDKSWNRLADCRISAINTTYPFDAGSLRMTETGGILYIHTCHEMYRSSDGYNHQANMTFEIRESDMVCVDKWTGVMNISYGYVSHSFNEFIRTDGQYVYRVDHGDAYPRGISLTAIRAGDHVYRPVSYETLITFEGETGANYTGASVGGYELSDSSHLIAFNMDADMTTGKTRNICIAVRNKQSKEVSIQNITSYTDEGDVTCKTPQLVKIDGTHFLLMWKETDRTTNESVCRLVILNGEGVPQTEITDKGILKLSDCQPIVLSDGTVAWYVSDGTGTALYRIDPFDPEGIKECTGDHRFGEGIQMVDPGCTTNGALVYTCSECGLTRTETIPPLGHDWEVLHEENGVFTKKCRRCGKEETGAGLTSFSLYWKKTGTSGSYWSYTPSGLEAGDSVGYLVTNTEYSADGSVAFSDLTAESDDPENCIIDLVNRKVTFLKKGTYTVKFRSVCCPDVQRTYVFTVNGSLNSVVLTADTDTVIPYGQQVHLNTETDGRKGTLQYTYVLTDPAGNEVTFLSDSYVSETSWTPERTGTYSIRVDVCDTGDGNRTVSSEALQFEVVPADTAVAKGKSVKAAATLTYTQKLSELSVVNASFVSGVTGKTVAGTFAFDHPDEILPAGEHQAAWTFTPDSAYYNPLSGTLTVQVDKAEPVISTMPEAGTAVYHPALKTGDIAITGGASIPDGHWEWENKNSSLSVPGGSYDCIFIPDDTDNYESVKAQLAIKVSKAEVKAQADTPEITYGQKLGGITLSGMAVHAADKNTAVAGVFKVTAGELIPTVADSLTTQYDAEFIPEDTINYQTAALKFKVLVSKAQKPPVLPPEKISVPVTCETVSADLLIDYPDWSFAKGDIGKTLTIGAEENFTLIYTGADAGNYLQETAGITIVRSACSHDGETEIINAADPTCTLPGATGDEYCSLCGELIRSSTEIPAPGHDWDEGEITSGDSCTTGIIKTFTCLRCGEEKEEFFPSAGHTLSEVPEKDPDCTTDGNLAFWRCEVCNKLFLDEEALIETTPEAVVIPATGHFYGSWETVEQPTATTPGLQKRTCTVCGDEETEEIPVVAKTSIKKAKITGLKTKIWTGSAIKQNIQVTLKGITLVKGQDYSVSYKNNKNPGTATVVVKGRGNYKGSVTAAFKILPKSTSLKSISSKSLKVTVKWKKQASQTNGYQLAYSRDKNFKSGVTYANMNKASKTSYTTGKLTKGKKYYFCIRTYKMVKGEKVFSKWSAVRSVQVK